MKRIKKSIALLLSLSLLLGLCGVSRLSADADDSLCEVAAFEDDFDGEPKGWTFVDKDGDGDTWSVSDNPNFAKRSGTGILQSSSYDYTLGGALDPDNWAFTPPIRVPEEATLSFWVCQQDSAWTSPLVEKFEVYAFALTDPEAPSLPTGDYTTVMTKIAEGQTEGQQEYTEVTADLSAFAGQTVYLAIRHFDSYNQFKLNVDDFVVRGAHTYGTEGADAYTCTACGKVDEARRAQVLADTVTLVPAQDPTCTEDGFIDHFIDDSGSLYQLDNATGDYIPTTIDDLTIPALGHNDGLWQVDFEATPEHDGQMTRRCTRCGELLETMTWSAIM